MIGNSYNIPQGYKQTELGIIPEDWQLQSVGKHCTVKARIGWQGLRSDEYLESGEYGLITSTDIVDGTINWDTCYFVDKSRYIQDPNIIIQEDDTLISKDGTIGKVGIVQNIPFPSTLNSGVFVVRPKFDNVYKKYLAFAFKSVYFQDFINRLTAGSTIVHLYQKDIVKFMFPVPPIAEQRAIAEALSDVDGLIAALDKKIAKKRLLKQGVMQQLLTGKKRLPGFTYEWVVKKLGDLSHIKTGNRNGDEAIENGKYPFYVRSKKVYAIDSYSFDGEAILVPGEGGIGSIFHYVNGKFDYHQRVYKISNFAKDVCGKYIYFYKEIADLEAQRDKYRLLKSGMMQKLLTGQIRLVKPLAKIIPLVPEVSVAREIPVDAHIIAGHIVNKSYQSRGWGRTKLQKSLHLVGYCMQLNLGNEYIRNTAGPDDQQLMNYIDQKFKQYRHVNKVCEKLSDGRTHYSYTPTPMIQEVEAAYERYPQELREQIDALIDKLNTMDLAGAEILSTLYAVWNNRIIKKEQVTDNLLIADFYAWSEHKADFEEARVRKALNYMRKENIVPIGWGKYIDKR